MSKIILLLTVLLTTACVSTTTTEETSLAQFVKAWEYKEDNENIDFWQDPIMSMETMQGDCEDLVLLMIYTLVQTNESLDNTEVLFGTTQQGGHMVLKHKNTYYDTYGVSNKKEGFTVLMTIKGNQLTMLINPEFIKRHNQKELLKKKRSAINGQHLIATTKTLSL